jgi:8-oxo-dGTP diphosphatase
MKILYGTKNKAKLASMRRTLSSLDVEIIGLNDLNTRIPEVEESGSDPLENARIKALAYYKEFHIPVCGSSRKERIKLVTYDRK